MFLFSIYLQIGLGYRAATTGLALGPWALGIAVGAGLSGGLLTPRLGRHALHLGIALLAIGVGSMLFVVHRGSGTSIWPFVVPELFAGLGMGVVVAPLFRFVLAGIEDHEVGSASGVLNAMQQLGAAAGIALVGTLFFRVARTHGFARALEQSLWVELALLAASAALVLFLPRTVPEEGGGEAAVVATEPA
jgi:hypothetical protein